MPEGFDAKARRSQAVEQHSGFDASDALDFEKANDLASRQESLADNWRGRYDGEGKAGIWDICDDERRMGSSVGGMPEIFGERLGYGRNSVGAIGPIPQDTSAAGAQAAVRPKKSIFSKLFNMKSGYLNPLAWLYQGAKGIGKGVSRMFGGGGQPEAPETDAWSVGRERPKPRRRAPRPRAIDDIEFLI